MAMLFCLFQTRFAALPLTLPLRNDAFVQLNSVLLFTLLRPWVCFVTSVIRQLPRAPLLVSPCNLAPRISTAGQTVNATLFCYVCACVLSVPSVFVFRCISRVIPFEQHKPPARKKQCRKTEIASLFGTT